MNKHATDAETYVAVSLCLDDGTLLRVKRSWTAKGKKVDQNIIVEKNGVVDKYLGESWSYYIEEILPFGIARFFFFNNEKITQLADDSSFEQIKSSIKSAIGVSTIEKAIEHTDEVIRRKKNALAAFENSEENVGYQEVEKQIADIDVLCRWALCWSLSEPSVPGGVDPLSDSNVEMDWSTFAGEYSEIYEAIIRQRCINDGLGDDEKTLAKYFRLHLSRGINHYSTRDVLKNCSDLLKSALPKEEA